MAVVGVAVSVVVVTKAVVVEVAAAAEVVVVAAVVVVDARMVLGVVADYSGSAHLILDIEESPNQPMSGIRKGRDWIE